MARGRFNAKRNALSLYEGIMPVYYAYTTVEGIS